MLDNLDPVLLARIQFAFTISFHILFPAFTIGLASWLAVVEFTSEDTAFTLAVAVPHAGLVREIGARAIRGPGESRCFARSACRFGDRDKSIGAFAPWGHTR